jgi:hypothetical protein
MDGSGHCFNDVPREPVALPRIIFPYCIIM